MKIIVHGEIIKYICPVCGCVWLASEDESMVENLYSYEQIVAQSFYCDCPDCFQRRVEGQKLKAIVAKEGERCICCGEIIPEGRQVCPKCEKQGNKN